MRNSLFRQLFFAFSAVILLVLISVLLFVNWSFERGFNDYLLAQEKQRLVALGERLIVHYERAGSWQNLERDSSLWRRQVGGPEHTERRPPPPPDRGRDRGAKGRPPPKGPPRAGTRLFEHRVALVNSQVEWLAGSRRVHEQSRVRSHDVHRLPLELEGERVGELLLQPPEVLDNKLARSFQDRQLGQLMWVAPVALLLGLLAAALLVRHFLRPIKSMAAGTRQLAAGKFSHRLAVKGQDELAQLSNDFNQLAQSLEAEQRLRQQWIADTSHELRTPLAVLRSEIEALQDGIREASPDRISALHAQVLSLAKLVDDLHQLSLGDAGLLNIQLKCLNLGDLLQDLVIANEARANKLGLGLQLSGAETAMPVMGDATRLLQLFNNLLDNSMRHTRTGGRIEIALNREANSACVSIADSEPGVSEASLPRLFERLYRPDESRNRSEGGSGLGLAIARQISEAHGASLSAGHSELGGLKLCLRLPLIEQKPTETKHG